MATHSPVPASLASPPHSPSPTSSSQHSSPDMPPSPPIHSPAEAASPITSASSTSPIPTTPHPNNHNNDVDNDSDDIFSTSPDLPPTRFPPSTGTTTLPSAPTHDPANSIPICTSSPSTTRRPPAKQAPSEVTALRRTLLTDGYRAGVDAAKSDPGVTQAAFDRGFGVGARIGLKAGWALAVLERQGRRARVEDSVVADGLGGAHGVVEAEAEIDTADRELDVAEYVKVAGLSVGGEDADGEGEGADDAVDVLVQDLPDVPAAWPALNAWTTRAREVGERRSVDRRDGQRLDETT